MDIIKFVILYIVFIISINSQFVREVNPSELRVAIQTPKRKWKHVLVEFYAPWCHHCQQLEPKYEYIGRKLKSDGDILVLKINAEKYWKELSNYNIKGYPTIKLFRLSTHTQEEKYVQDVLDYNGLREPKQLLNFINKQCNTDFNANDWVPTSVPIRPRTPDMKKLSNCIQFLNQFHYKDAIRILKDFSMEKSRSATTAKKILLNQNVIGAQVDSFKVDEWLQVSQKTYIPPILDDAQVTVFVRLDLKSGNRQTLDIKLDQLAELEGLQLIRLTGSDWDMSNEYFQYPVAIASVIDSTGVVKGKLKGHFPMTIKRLFELEDYQLGNLESLLKTMHNVVIIYHNRIIWNAHVGIVDETLIKSLHAIIDNNSSFNFNLVDNINAK